jgi:hypothetical protein
MYTYIIQHILNSYDIPGPYFALVDDEEVCGVAGGDHASGVQHERFVRIGLGSRDARRHAVDLAVAVQLLVLHVWVPTTH